jgi:hypothetical protein
MIIDDDGGRDSVRGMLLVDCNRLVRHVNDGNGDNGLRPVLPMLGIVTQPKEDAEEEEDAPPANRRSRWDD